MGVVFNRVIILVSGDSNISSFKIPGIDCVYLHGNHHVLKAIVYNEYGCMDVLHISEVDKPVPGADEVLIRNYAASLNDWDFGLIQGDFVNRILNGLRKPKRQILGSDIAGTIEAVGKDVTRFKAGDDVYGDLSGRWGGFAEYCCAPEDALALKPGGMSFIEAAAIPQAAMLAVQGLIDTGKIRSGMKLLINGAGGGVGTFGIQLAKLYDVIVTAVDSTTKLDRLRSMGFEHVIDYTREDFTKNGERYDLILDVKTNRPISAYARSLVPGGAYVTVGGSMWRLLQAFVWAPWMVRLRNKQFRIVSLKPNKDLPFINELFNAGKLKPVIEGPYSVNNFQEAFRIFEKAEHVGKVVIVF